MKWKIIQINGELYYFFSGFGDKMNRHPYQSKEASRWKQVIEREAGKFEYSVRSHNVALYKLINFSHL